MYGAAAHPLSHTGHRPAQPCPTDDDVDDDDEDDAATSSDGSEEYAPAAGKKAKPKQRPAPRNTRAVSASPQQHRDLACGAAVLLQSTCAVPPALHDPPSMLVAS